MTPRPPRRAAVDPVPGPAREPGSVSPPVAEPGTPSSPQPGERQAAGTDPVTGAGGLPSPAPGRAPRAPAIAAAMTEAKLEEHVRELCKGLGIVRIHIYNSRGTTPGVPDDILVGPCGVLWRELKTMRGKVTPAQQAMGEALLAAGQDWAAWRPADLLSWRIARELVEISGRPLGIGAGPNVDDGVAMSRWMPPAPYEPGGAA